MISPSGRIRSLLCQRSIKLNCGCGAGDTFMALRAHLSPLWRRVGCRLEFGKIDGFEQIFLAVEDADVRSVEFVSRAGQKITIRRFHIAEEIRSVVHGINQLQLTNDMCNLDGASILINSPQRITAGAERYQLRFLCHQPLEIVPIELSSLGIHLTNP